jgi:hypothetical protein
MSIKKWIATGTVALGLLSGGVALATGASASGTPSNGEDAVTAQTADTDNVQVEQGDQNAPDTEGTESKSATESDGPGGHEDPAGNVNHQFEGEE